MLIVLGQVAAFAGLLVGQPAASAIAQTVADPVRVTGTLLLLADDRERGSVEIELPDQKVVLRREGREDVNTAVTALDGGFEAMAPAPGIYQVCWELGGSKGCGGRFQVGDSTVSAGLVRARIERPFVHGVVLTGDRRPCWINDSFFGLDVSTEVTGGGFSARANTEGEYALIGPAPGTFRVTARCEQASEGATVTLAGAPLRQDVSLGNRAPHLGGLSATDGARGLTRAALGQTLKLISESRDPDGDVIEYVWRTLDGTSGALSGSTGSTETWQLPATAGLQQVYVLARDGKGGYAFKRFDLQVGAAEVDFSGQVIDEVNRSPVRSAEVAVGGSRTTTNENGWFSIRSAPLPDDRYVLNITHPSYALLSRVYDRSANGNTYELIRAQVTTQSGANPLIVEDRRSAGPCGSGPDGQEGRLRRLVAPVIVDDGSEAEPAERRRVEEAIRAVLQQQSDCRPRGAQIRIPAGALVDENGRNWTGAVRSTVATLNPARRALPGDYQAITASGERAEMLSFGAVYAAFTDLRGRKLDLQPGTTAEISVPVSDFQRPASPPTIALWSYDEQTGFWREEGTASLQNTPQGWMYVGQVEHFSTINMDVAGTDPAVATCVRLELDAAFSAWSNLILRAYVSYGGTSVQVKETPLDTAQYHAIYRIPFGTAFPPNTLRLELRGTSNGQQLVLLDNIINTDARPKMTGTDLWPPYPYTECGDPILLTAAPGVVPVYGDLDATGRPAFLSGPFGSFNPPDGAQKSADYYAALDPGGNKDTLGEWWQVNGFGADGLGAGNPTYVRQAYLNHNDLGFGRDMHCANNGANLACYVTNYGLPDQNPDNADAAEGQIAAKRGATVAMEYDNAAPVAERVQFFVFGGGVAGSGRINFADLDGLGPKPVPFLCAVCHGGRPSLNAANKVEFARFREFDLPSFRYSGGRSWNFGQATLNATELANFAKLNQQVRNAAAGTPIAALIDGWYPGGFGGGPAPVLPAAPAGWSTQVSGYHNVYGTACRTCHVARDEGNLNNYYVLGSSGNFAGTAYAVCGDTPPKRRVMPNAVVTYKNFWADLLRVQQYETLMVPPVVVNNCGQ